MMVIRYLWSWSTCLGIVAVIGDWIVDINTNSIHKAITDNAIHGFIGLLTWLIIVFNYNTRVATTHLWEVCICGLCSSAIDIDHFVAARSFKLQDALNLSSRPFLHCSSVPLTICAVLITLAHIFRFTMVLRYSWLLLAAFLSHHIRDATRRGLWMWPFGSTPPLPYLLYIGLTIGLPHVISLAMKVMEVRHVQHPLQVWEEDWQVQLYAITGCLGGIILCVFGLVVYLCIRVKRLKMRISILNSDNNNYMKPDIQPNEELAKRGFSMYAGMEDDKSEKNYYSTVAPPRTNRNPYSSPDANSTSQLFASDRY